MNAKIAFAGLVLLAAPSSAYAQVAVSMGVGNNLAYNCYISALMTAKGGRPMAASEGIGNCSAALLEPANAEIQAATYDNRGILYDATQNYSAAYSDFNTSIRLNANLGDAWLNRGVAKIRMKDPQAALSDLQHGLSLGPSMPEVGYYDMGVAEILLGRIPEAYADFKRALAADPNFTLAADALKNFTVQPGPDPGKNS
jgi:tetratricopeptide (TPR) repeat protein